MGAKLPANVELVIQSLLGATAQTDRGRSVRERPKLGAPSVISENNASSGVRLLPMPDIARALWRYTNDPDLRGEWRRVPIEAVAAIAQLSRPTIYEARRGRMTEDTRAILSKIIPQIESGEIRFRRVGRQWETEFRRPPARRPPPRDRLTRAADHREWAQCRTCQGDRWEAIEMHGTAWVACAQCIPKSQWPAIGATGA
jgi:hypothetical protein